MFIKTEKLDKGCKLCIFFISGKCSRSLKHLLVSLKPSLLYGNGSFNLVSF